MAYLGGCPGVVKVSGTEGPIYSLKEARAVQKAQKSHILAQKCATFVSQEQGIQSIINPHLDGQMPPHNLMFMDLPLNRPWIRGDTAWLYTSSCSAAGSNTKSYVNDFSLPTITCALEIRSARASSNTTQEEQTCYSPT